MYVCMNVCKYVSYVDIEIEYGLVGQEFPLRLRMAACTTFWRFSLTLVMYV